MHTLASTYSIYSLVGTQRVTTTLVASMHTSYYYSRVVLKICIKLYLYMYIYYSYYSRVAMHTLATRELISSDAFACIYASLIIMGITRVAV